MSFESTTATTWDFDQLTRLVAHVETLSPSEHHEISTILRNHCIHVSRNNNGEFVNIASVPEFVLNEISNFVTYCVANKQQVEEYNNKLEEYKLRGTISRPEETDVENVTPTLPPKSPPKSQTSSTTATQHNRRAHLTSGHVQAAPQQFRPNAQYSRARRRLMRQKGGGNNNGCVNAETAVGTDSDRIRCAEAFDG